MSWDQAFVCVGADPVLQLWKLTKAPSIETRREDVPERVPNNP